MDDSRNPMLQSKVIARARSDAEAAAAGEMTISGTISKTGILFLILVAGGAMGWNMAENHTGSTLVMAGGIIGFILALMLSFMPAMSAILAPAYALVEGLVIGFVSCLYDTRFPGIAGNAMILTFGTLGVMLACYRFGLLRATERFMRVVVIATLAIMAAYIVDMIMGIFGHPLAMIHQATPLGIGFSLVITAVAALNLILDFSFIEQAARNRMPRYMEWYSGFALLVTLVWLYMEILRLLGKLNERNR